MNKKITGKLEQAYRLLYSKYLNYFIDMILVVEYPKSGGTWLGQLISDYFDLDFPRNEFPSWQSSLIHGHYTPSRGYSRSKKIIWLIRDGRDVMVSYYHHCLIWNDKNKLSPKDIKYHRNAVSFDDFENVKKNLPAFIEYSYTHKPSPLQHFTHPGTWASFNRSWLKASKNNRLDIVHTKYEDLLSDTETELTRILHEGFSINVDPDKVSEIVYRYSFENQTTRKKGEESKSSFLRKGISGDWKNYFTEEAAEIFDYYAGEILIQLGYESDNSWKDRIDA